MHTRKVVGWSMRETPHASIALEALDMAIKRQRAAPGLIRRFRTEGSKVVSTGRRNAAILRGEEVLVQCFGRCSPSPKSSTT